MKTKSVSRKSSLKKIFKKIMTKLKKQSKITKQHKVKKIKRPKYLDLIQQQCNNPDYI